MNLLVPDPSRGLGAYGYKAIPITAGSDPYSPFYIRVLLLRETKMEQRNQIYFKQDMAFESELKKLKEWKTSARNKELITKFHNHLFSTGSKQLRVSKVSSQIRRMCLVLNRELKINNDLDKLNTEDIQAVVAFYARQEGLSEATKADINRAIKQFWGWFKDIDVRLESTDRGELKEGLRLYKYIERELKRCYKPQTIEFSAILSNENIDIVLNNGCRSIKERAFIKLLHETGARVGEFLNIRFKDIQITENLGQVQVDGKTGQRTIPFLESLPYLVQWMDYHPFKGNSEAFLWVGESPTRMYQPLKYFGGKRLIHRCFERANLKKKHNFHWFRHSRATLLAPKLTESMMGKYFGWAPGSKEMKTYVHLCTKQLETAFLEIHGLQREEDKQIIRIQKCLCGTINKTEDRYCAKCGKPLNVSVVLQDEQRVKQLTDEALQRLREELLEDPNFLNKVLAQATTAEHK